MKQYLSLVVLLSVSVAYGASKSGTDVSNSKTSVAAATAAVAAASNMTGSAAAPGAAVPAGAEVEVKSRAARMAELEAQVTALLQESRQANGGRVSPTTKRAALQFHTQVCPTTNPDLQLTLDEQLESIANNLGIGRGLPLARALGVSLGRGHNHAVNHHRGSGMNIRGSVLMTVVPTFSIGRGGVVHGGRLAQMMMMTGDFDDRGDDGSTDSQPQPSISAAAQPAPVHLSSVATAVALAPASVPAAVTASLSASASATASVAVPTGSFSWSDVERIQPVYAGSERVNAAASGAAPAAATSTAAVSSASPAVTQLTNVNASTTNDNDSLLN